jgi:hypothetical protein
MARFLFDCKQLTPLKEGLLSSSSYLGDFVHYFLFQGSFLMNVLTQDYNLFQVISTTNSPFFVTSISAPYFPESSPLPSPFPEYIPPQTIHGSEYISLVLSFTLLSAIILRK